MLLIDFTQNDLTVNNGTTITAGSGGDVLTGMGCCGAGTQCGQDSEDVGKCHCCDSGHTVPDPNADPNNPNPPQVPAEVCVNELFHICCAPDQTYVEGSRNCCDKGEVVSGEGLNATCCPAKSTARWGGCCDEDSYCAAEQVCLGTSCTIENMRGKCCPNGTTQCKNACCGKNETCNTSGNFGFGSCCPEKTTECGSGCCTEDEHCDVGVCVEGTPAPVLPDTEVLPENEVAGQ